MTQERSAIVARSINGNNMKKRKTIRATGISTVLDPEFVLIIFL
jgi:hypothetical protein